MFMLLFFTLVHNRDYCSDDDEVPDAHDVSDNEVQGTPRLVAHPHQHRGNNQPQQQGGNIGQHMVIGQR